MNPLRPYLRPRKWEPVIGWWIVPAMISAPFVWWGIFCLLTWIF